VGDAAVFGELALESFHLSAQDEIASIDDRLDRLG
jgi:hypothetical protein